MRGTKPIGNGDAVEIVDLNAFLEDLRQAVGPTLDEHRETWEREKPAAMERAEGMGITIDQIGGNCPVQAEGEFDGLRFYFRARYDEWQFHVWSADKARSITDLPFGDEDWLIERPFGEGEFDAGWMHNHEAMNFICESVEEYRKTHA